MQPAPEHAEIVHLEDVRKSYGVAPAQLEVLRGIAITVQRGEFVGIVGRSGSGKTTLMNLLGCLDRPTSGRYVLDGHDVSTLDDDRLSRVRNRSIGFIFQSFNLIPQLTVLENVEVPMVYGFMTRHTRRARAAKLLTSVGMQHRFTHHPTQLSGGECQRVAIARALANEPAMILADEPTGNLDSKNGEDVLELLHGLHRAGRTIVMVTHNPEIAARLPRVIEMRDGLVLDDRRNAAAANAPRAPVLAEAAGSANA